MLVSEMVDTASPVQVTSSCPDANDIAADAIAQALEYCARKCGLHDGQAALVRLKEGERAACQYCAYSIVQHFARIVGEWDDYVQAVYVIDYDATPDDLCFGCDGRTLPIHAIVWTARKTRALDVLVAALDRALVKQYRELFGLEELEHMLDVQVIDDADVRGRMGYGAMLASIHQQPIQVWSR
jgi:hypothetical protein